MKILLLKLKGIYYRIVGKTWIVASDGKACHAVPVYFVKVEK